MTAPIHLIEDGFYDDYDEPPRRHFTVPLVLLCFLVVAGIGLYWWTHR